MLHQGIIDTITEELHLYIDNILLQEKPGLQAGFFIYLLYSSNNITDFTNPALLSIFVII
jgi:hypothetical protein